MPEKELAQLMIDEFRRVKRLNHRIRSNTVLPDHEVMILNHIRMIKQVKEAEGQTGTVMVSELAEALMLTKSAISKTLSTLEGKGYIARSGEVRDRRIVYVDLTETGTEVLDQAHAEVLSRMKRILDRMGEEDAREMLRLYDKLSGIIETL